MLYCLPELLASWFQRIFHFLNTSLWEQKSKGLGQFGPQGHGWQDLCRGSPNIDIYLNAKVLQLLLKCYFLFEINILLHDIVINKSNDLPFKQHDNQTSETYFCQSATRNVRQPKFEKSQSYNTLHFINSQCYTTLHFIRKRC